MRFRIVLFIYKLDFSEFKVDFPSLKSIFFEITVDFSKFKVHFRRL